MSLSDKKRGLSTIVATLIIILLVLVAVGILWVVVRNLIQSNAEQVSLGKLTLDLSIEKVQLEGNNLSVTVKRNAGKGEFVALSFVVEDGQNSEVFTKEISMNELDVRTFILTLNQTNPDNITRINIIPIFRLTSGREIVGEIRDTWERTSSFGVYKCTSNCPLGAECGSNGCLGGTCGTCSDPATPTCVNYQCVAEQTCTSNCTGRTCGSDGCEGNCGTCTNPHGTTSCVTGNCQPVCESGYDSCDLIPSNGCETLLGTIANCANCSNSCLTGQNCTLGVCMTPQVPTCGDGTCNGTETCSNCVPDCACLNGYTCATNGTCVPAGACVDTSIKQNFEGSFLPTGWTTGGNAVWNKNTTYVVSGIASAASGHISNSQMSWINYTNTFSEDGYVSFYWNVSSEFNYDYLCFCKDKACGVAGGGCECTNGGTGGSADAKICSDTHWVWKSGFVNQTYTAGTHSFIWCFSKDSGDPSPPTGPDMGIIDNVIFMPKSSCIQEGCTDTCASLGHNCGSVCGNVCGSYGGGCQTGYTCNSTGLCEIGAETSIVKTIASSSDDAEENLSNNKVSSTSSDLELTYDDEGSMNQYIGMRFQSINIPQGTTIKSAVLEFQCDEASSGAGSVQIWGEDIDNAPTFLSGTGGNITNRILTSNFAPWTFGSAWSVGTKYNSSDFKNVIQEIVDRPGWVANNNLVIVINSSLTSNANSRIAVAYDPSGLNAAKLYVTY